MNYKFMDLIKNGILIIKTDTTEVIYINSVAEKLLNTQDNNNINILKNYLLTNGKSILSTSDEIIKVLKNNDLYRDTMFVKSVNNIFLEIDFDCTFLDESQEFISIIFQNATETNNSKDIKFHEVTESLPSGVIVMDVEDELSVAYANAEHYKIMGIDESKQELNTILKDTIYEEDKDWVMEEIYRNLYMEKDVDIEFRMKVQNNHIKWVRLYGRAKKSSSGNMLFYSSLKDLSNRREINDKLHLERVLFHKMTEMSDEILFRLDLNTHIVNFLGTQFEKVFQTDNNVIENFPQTIINSNIIPEDDMPIFDSMTDSFKSGDCKLIELRLNLPTGTTEWHHIQYNFVKSSDGKPLLVVGKLINIQKQKWLEEQAKIDLLTGFYNKINTAIEVNKLIVESKHHEEFALFIIDIDNFKAINDNLGHHFGDIVLHDIANDIRNCFRKGDILGRIGGDEFIVVIKNCNDINIIKEKANQLCNVLEKTFMGQNKNYPISASIGISKYPSNGESYEILYKKADIALYKTKERGKNDYTIYSSILTAETKQIPSKIHTSKRNDGALIDFTVIANVFNLLYETSDIQLSLNTILEYIGMTYKVDRCYIFQTLDDDSHIFKNDYQWDKNLGFITEDRVQYVPERVLMSIFEHANEDGAYCTNNIYEVTDKEAIKILEEDKVVSIYIVESLKKRIKKSFFGIEDCHNKRVWTQQEQRTLFHVGRMIFGSLTSHNYIQNLHNKLAKLETNTLN